MRATCLSLLLAFAASPWLAAGDDPALGGIWMMGQSLGDGSESLPLVTPDDTGWENFAFKRGVRTWLPGSDAAKPEERPADQFALVSLRAEANGGLGETVANGLADHLKSALVAKERRPDKTTSPHFLVAFAGQGGRQIQELSPADFSTAPARDLASPAPCFHRHRAGESNGVDPDGRSILFYSILLAPPFGST